MPLKDSISQSADNIIMPDHIHLFVRGGPDFILSEWVKGLKRAISKATKTNEHGVVWQPGFFDYILRNDESYSEKMAVRLRKSCNELAWQSHPTNGPTKVKSS